MKLIPNPEYETARYQAACLDEKGKQLPEQTCAIFFGRPKPPRYKEKGSQFVEVPSFILDDPQK